MNNSPLPQEDQSKYVRAFDKRRAEIEAVPEDDLVHMNLQVMPATTNVLVAHEKIVPMREEFAKLPGYDIKNFDDLPEYTMALAHAQTRCAWETKSADELTQQVASLQASRDLFTADIDALAKRNLFSNDQLKRVPTATSHRDVAYSVMELTSFLREHWSMIEGRCALTLTEIEAASKLAGLVAERLAARPKSKTDQTPATLLRDKAYALFFKAHKQVRRAVEYFHFDDEEKIDELFPSLFAGRGGRKPNPKPEKEASQGAASAPVAPTNGGVPTPSPAPPPPVTGGMPGGSPVT